MIRHELSRWWSHCGRYWRHMALFVAARLLAVLPFIALPAYAGQDNATFDHSIVKAQGQQAALFSVAAFGRYALAVKSNQGVALQLIDAMAGPGPIAGSAGQQDGRIDQFLDRGRYKLITLADEHGLGDAQLSIHPFQELHSKPPLLIENRLEKTELNDYEQRSYWIEIPAEQDVAIEAAGRHLADLRLWRDGTWLVAAEPTVSLSEPRPNRPLRICRLNTRLEPGLYRLTAYGGTSSPWTEQSEDRPLFLRMGIPKLGYAGRQRFIASEFGSDRYLIPRQANYFRLELSQPGQASLSVGDYDASNPFDNNGSYQAIRKETQPPVAELHRDGSADWQVVTVTAPAGSRFVLQQFEQRDQYGFQGGGDYWISTLHGGHAGDAAGAGAVLTQRSPRLPKETYVADRAVNLDNTTGWQRRFNLLEEATLFFNVQHSGKYRLDNRGSRARFRFEPFVTSRPEKYRPPPFRDSGYTFDLEAGLYTLVFRPEDQGIVDVTITPEAPRDNVTINSGQAAANFAVQHLRDDTEYRVYVNQQPGVPSGLVVRSVPIDLSEPLPLTSSTTETFTLPITLPAAGILRAVAESGEDLPLQVEGSERGVATKLAAGRHTLTLRPQSTEIHYSLVFTPQSQDSAIPLPGLPDGKQPVPPNFAELTVTQPRFFDLQRGSAVTYWLKAPAAALYRLESTGLLHTRGTLRTRLQPRLFSADANGTGRNFLIQHYLREGDYQITVATQNRSQGHGAVRVVQAPLLQGGELRDGTAVHTTLSAGQAVLYSFPISQRGRYRLQALGMDRLLNVRVEDSDGWPILAPGIAGDITREFAPGKYRLLVLPEPASVRALTLLTALPEPPQLTGHGPHAIALNTTQALLWEEPPAPAARTPDQWTFELPAPAQITVQLTNDMVGELFPSGHPTAPPLAQITAVRPWQGPLPSGAYRLETRQRRANNRVPYSLTISSRELLTGQTRVITAPAAVPVSIGKSALVELTSLGNSDVQARLYDAAGNLVAQNDDAPDDWNFRLATWLQPGNYRLEVAAVHQSTATTTVSLMSPAEVTEPALAAGQSAQIQDVAVHVYPLVTAQQDFVAVSAQGNEPAGLLLEVLNEGGPWRPIAHDLGKSAFVAAPRRPDRQYRLRAWSSERRGTPIALRFAAIPLTEQDEATLRRGHLKFQTLNTEPLPAQVAAVRLDQPGLFKIRGDVLGVTWTDDWNHPLRPLTADPIINTSSRLWLLQRTAKSKPLESTRVVLDSGARLRFTAPAHTTAQLDLAEGRDDLRLLLARAPFGMPALAVSGIPADAIGLTMHSALIPLAGTAMPASVRIWNGLDPHAPLDVTVHSIGFAKSAPSSMALGITDANLDVSETRSFQLPSGTKRLHITLTPGVAAVLTANGRPQTTLWSDTQPLTETLTSSADGLMLINSASAGRSFRVELMHDDNADNAVSLAPGTLYGRQFATQGAQRLSVSLPPSAGKTQWTLHVRGASQALFIADDGMVQTGTDITVTRHGALRLQHDPGTVMAWLESPMQTTAPEILVTPPQQVALAGREQVLRFQLARPTLLSLDTSVPVGTWFSTADLPPQIALHPAGTRDTLFLPAGETRLWLKPVGNASLDGKLTVLALDAQVINDNAAERAVLSPGGGRLYRFSVTHTGGPIGIGIRASSDLVTSRLYDTAGHLRGEGLVQMPELTSGQYYLAVQAPANSPPVTVEPLLVGLTAAPATPPADIVRRFVEAKAESAPALIYVPPTPETDGSNPSTGEASETASADMTTDTPRDEESE